MGDNVQVTPHAHQFGACLRGIDLSQPLAEDTLDFVRQCWLRYQVIYFPEQPLNIAQLERFSRQLGPLGVDPFVEPMRKHPHVLEVKRHASEAVVPFGSSWHSDWSFQAKPPAATLLFAKIVPPKGGDTHFSDGFRAYDLLPTSLQDSLEGMRAIHSARRPYSMEGYRRSGGPLRSMVINPSEDAWDTQTHPLIRTHPESGRRALWLNAAYTIAIEGLSEAESDHLLKKLLSHMLQPKFIYPHRWQTNMLTIWDNRSVQHCAQDGYRGFERVMYRTTTVGDTPA